MKIFLKYASGENPHGRRSSRKPLRSPRSREVRAFFSCLTQHPSVSSITTEWTPVRLTLLGRADEVPDAPNTAIILALRFIQLHAHPLATGELRGPAEPQRARLEETREDMAWVALGGHDKITGTGKSLVVQWLRVSTFTAEGSGSVLGDLAYIANQ